MKKKLLVPMLLACMSVSLLSGCGGNSTSTSNSNANANSSSTESSTEATENGEEVGNLDTSEHVVLTMYCIGDEGGIYADQHLEEVNRILTEKINAEIDPVMVSWGEYKQKLPMVWASGEAYDLTYTSNWSGYFTEGEKGAFMDISELLPQYAPETYAELEARGALDSIRIGGKIYMVPNDNPDFTTYILNYREDLRKKYNCPEIVDHETLNTYLQAIKDNEPGMRAYSNNATEATKYQLFLNENDWSRPVDSAMGIYVYDLKNPNKVFDVTETPEYKEFLDESRDYYNNGYWSQSIMAETETPKDSFLNGKAAVYLANISNSNGVYATMSSSNPDWEIGYVSLDLGADGTGIVEEVSPANNGMAVGAYSENPERALMFVELMYTDQEVYDVVMNGLEGITYEADREKMVKWIPEGTDPNDTSLRNLGMGFGSTRFHLGSLNDSETVLELKEKFGAQAIYPELAGFSVNQDNISAELAAIKAVVDEYKVPMDKGVNDVESGLETLHKKIAEAGGEKVLADINAQIEAYLSK